MEREEALRIFKDSGVMLEGHFLLTSGRHGAQYMQCAKLFEHPPLCRLMSQILADAFAGDEIDTVVGPAVGGIILAYQVADCLGARSIFAERQDGAMTLRRGFSVREGERMLVVEDVVTTGGSVKEVVSLLKNAGAVVVGVGVIVDRSGGKADFGVPLHSVVKMDIASYAAEECPLCEAGSVAVKLGSRNLK